MCLTRNVKQCGHFALLNTLTGKGTFLRDFISDSNCDMLMLTETWQGSNDFVELNLLSPPGFSSLTKPWIGGRGGGLAVVYRQSLHINLSPFHEVTSFEYLAFKITSHSSLHSSYWCIVLLKRTRNFYQISYCFCPIYSYAIARVFQYSCWCWYCSCSRVHVCPWLF